MRAWCTQTLILLALLLAGCASIPLSTALRFANWDARDLARVDPAQVRVRVSVDEGIGIDVDGTRLGMSLIDDAGVVHAAELPLTLLASRSGTRPGGWFRSDIPVDTVVLALTPDGADKLVGMRQLVLSGQPREFSLKVWAKLAEVPPETRAVRFWADVRLGEDEPYVTVIDGAELEMVRE
ncbi:hypothetical protein [Cognatiluteimonas lumbrici]|uniref:hypothetical protein n=1 Tax=Cognatiluteimonas lumbrici TaxID=2559601 RepID=UPI00112B5899|nr:hypothetical protein [Luteimonas lumbrici]